MKPKVIILSNKDMLTGYPRGPRGPGGPGGLVGLVGLIGPGGLGSPGAPGSPGRVGVVQLKHGVGVLGLCSSPGALLSLGNACVCGWVCVGGGRGQQAETVGLVGY